MSLISARCGTRIPLLHRTPLNSLKHAHGIRNSSLIIVGARARGPRFTVKDAQAYPEYVVDFTSTRNWLRIEDATRPKSCPKSHMWENKLTGETQIEAPTADATHLPVGWSHRPSAMSGKRLYEYCDPETKKTLRSQLSDPRLNRHDLEMVDGVLRRREDHGHHGHRVDDVQVNHQHRGRHSATPSVAKLKKQAKKQDKAQHAVDKTAPDYPETAQNTAEKSGPRPSRFKRLFTRP